MRTTISIQGAREHNLRSVSVELPRDQLVVITGVSGSGKSSLAFDTIYAEGQRRYMESLSSFVRRFLDHLQKPKVDFMFGLSPVVSIEQKTISRTPRSTVGTMTDVASYLNLLFATCGRAHCPYCDSEVPVRSLNQLVEQVMSLPRGTAVEVRAPAFPVYGEELEFLFTEIRKRGYRRLLADGAPLDISNDVEFDNAAARLEVIVDRIAVKPEIEKSLKASLESALQIGERFVSLHVPELPEGHPAGRRFANAGCPHHHLQMGELMGEQFVFNDPASACRTCLGLGTHLQVHPELLVPDKSRSIADGCFVPQAFRYNRDTGDGRRMYSLAKHYGFGLDTPYRELPPEIVRMLLFGNRGEKVPMLIPEGAKTGHKEQGQEFRYDGIAVRIERYYRWYRQQQAAKSGMEDYLQKVMVEHLCPDCRGGRLRCQRQLVRLGGHSIQELGDMSFAELREFLAGLDLTGRSVEAGRQIVREILIRLDLLLGIGLDYLNFNRRSSTLSGGEAQRIRLSTQIGSGLMGMLYVLDEPSIGLHPKDSEKMIGTLRRLRDLGNTVIVVEHDEDTIRAADHVVEMGPGPGVHGGSVVAQGSLDDLLAHPTSLTGQFLSGRRSIPVPTARRQANGKALRVRGARENNLRSVDVSFPLGLLICVTGASGSGKSTLVNEILFKRMYAHLYDSRVLSGAHDGLDGIDQIKDVISIDQSAIGRSPRSNPATYVGFYDLIRKLFAETPESVARGYTPSRFSFNVKGGRCEECTGDGTVTTHLALMPDVEVRCEACKGARYNAETLEILYQGKNISEILELSIEEGVEFFQGQPGIYRRLEVLNDLGLGYLTLGQSSNTLSGGEAQRIKLANELSKLKRGGQILYILDEPTTGLHLADIERLLDCLNRLVEAGHTVVVIEHHLDVIKTADYVIDLGPEGGRYGGELLFAGTPEELLKEPRSFTGKYLRQHLAVA